MEIALYSKLQNPIEAIDRIGEMFAKSGMFGCDRSEQGKVLAMICLAEGKSPVAITRDYHIVEGKLSKKALAALAEFRSKGGKHKWLSSGDKPAAKEEDHYAEIELTDPEGNKTTYRYSMADARAEGLIKPKSRWEKRPGNMLRARCISNGLGMLCPEIFAGNDDSEDVVAPAAEMKLDTAAEAKREPKAANVETVSTVTTDAAKEVTVTVVTAEPVKQPEKPADTKTFKSGPVYTTTPKVGKLSDELVGQLEQVIGEHGAIAGKWMIAQGWLKPGEGLDSLTEGRAKRILKQRDSFIAAVTAAPQQAAA